MKLVKWLAIGLVIYVGIVVLFESAIGYFQPKAGSTLVLTTMDADGTPHERVVSRVESGGHLYVSANHWPRAWFARALANPKVKVTLDGQTGDYVAVPVSGEEDERVERENRHPFVFRLLTGFPPRRFLRLDPAE